MANEDARENPVLGKALGMAAVVGMTGGGIYLGAKGVGMGINGIKKGAKEMAEAWSDKGLKESIAQGDDILKNMQKDAIKNPDTTLKNTAKEVSSNIRNRATQGKGVSPNIENRILATSLGGKPMEDINPLHSPKSVSWGSNLPEVRTSPIGGKGYADLANDIKNKATNFGSEILESMYE